MSEKDAPKKLCPYFSSKKMGAPENKKRWAKNGQLKMQNRNSLKSKRKCVEESKFPPPVAIRRHKNKKKMGGRWAMCPSNKNEEDGLPKIKKKMGKRPFFLTHFSAPIFRLSLFGTRLSYCVVGDRCRKGLYFLMVNRVFFAFFEVGT